MGYRAGRVQGDGRSQGVVAVWGMVGSRGSGFLFELRRYVMTCILRILIFLKKISQMAFY